MFDIFGYLEKIEARLSRTDAGRRLAFANWCCAPLLEESAAYIGEKAGADSAHLLRAFHERVWEHVLAGAPAPTDNAGRVRAFCADVMWEEEDEGEAAQLANNAAVETLESLSLVCEVVEDGSARAAARTAEKLINRLDFELDMILGVGDPFAHPMLQEELERQQKMLEFLDSGAPLGPDTRRLFR